ncbi:MAG: T9SS type A sorting domain-containing protein [Ignavibacteriales bacterium]|nr:MAG: T9SS type A sorting domain-containing protein [Ignavibacteriales bacterium]
MKKNLILITIAAVVLIARAEAQSTPRIQMPYGVGNVWVTDVVNGNEKARFEYLPGKIIIDSLDYTILEGRSIHHVYKYYTRVRPDGYHVERVDSSVIAPNYEWIHWKENPQIGDEWVNQKTIYMWRYKITEILLDLVYGQPDTLYRLRISLDGNPYELFALYSLKFGILSYTADFETDRQMGCVINGVVYGDTTFYPWVSVRDEVMESDYRLEQNYPNPFNPSSEIRFRLPESSEIELGVYDILGNRVAVLAKGQYEQGSHGVIFDGAHLASGVYLYKLSYGRGMTLTRKMTLLK